MISGVAQPEPAFVIRECCAQRGCRLVELGADFDFDYKPPKRLDLRPNPGRITVRGHVNDFAYEYQDLPLGLVGGHQAANAAVAVATLVELRRTGWEIPEAALRTALAEAACPARVVVLSRRPTVVVDAAHNTASIDALVHTLNESFSAKRRRLLFATTEEKDVRGMLRRLLDQFDEVVFTQYRNNPRAVPPETLGKLAFELTGRRYPVHPDPADAWRCIRRAAAPEDLICVTGSFFIAAEMRQQICHSEETTPCLQNDA